MPILLIETSTERAMVALAKEDRLLFHADIPFGLQNSRHLIPQIDAGLRQLHLTMRQIRAIAVGMGPGSYTGMRVGAMTAKMLAFASSLPLIGICTLHTFISAKEAPFASLIDAKMGGAYVATGREGPPEVVPLEQLGSRLQEGCTLVTPNATKLKPQLTQLYPDKEWQWEEAAPNPLYMALLAQRKLAAGAYTVDGHLELLYLRKTQAEIEKER